mmetsp:Transcript_27989/g.63340  ORF Transcript_27989/g.63340 Transcript_27989/m.63340 type:complete len:225 (+) Transcript_27989:153-827(+)
MLARQHLRRRPGRQLVVFPNAISGQALPVDVRALAGAHAPIPLAVVDAGVGPDEAASAVLHVLEILALVGHDAAERAPLHLAVPVELAPGELAMEHPTVLPDLLALAVLVVVAPLALVLGALRGPHPLSVALSVEHLAPVHRPVAILQDHVRGSPRDQGGALAHVVREPTLLRERLALLVVVRVRFSGPLGIQGGPGPDARYLGAALDKLPALSSGAAPVATPL